MTSKDVVYPDSVGIETLNTCNARCIFCPLFQGDHQLDRKVRPATILEQATFEKYLAEIAGWERTPSTLFLNMDGEPLQDPLFCQRLEALKRFDLARVTSLQTNGQLLDEKKAQAILDAGLSVTVFGFDGATKAVYEAHRVRCVYEQVLANIKMLVSLRDAQGSSMPIQIKYVRTKRNCHEVRAAFEMFKGFMDKDKDVFWDTLAIDWGDELSKLGEEELYYIPRRERDLPLTGCASMSTQMVVTANDAIPACCFDYNFEVSAGGYRIGERTLLETWRCDERRALIAALESPDYSIKPEKCRTCPALCHFMIKEKPAPEVPEACRKENENQLGYCYDFGKTSN